MLRFNRRSPRHLKVAALVAATPTVAVLLLFAFGETSGGDVSGLQHLVQLLPLAVLLALAWRFPLFGGASLVGVALVLGALYPMVAGGSERVSTILLVELLFLAPPLVTGLLFFAAARARAA